MGAFDLLQEIGRDCVGALQLLPEDQIPPNIRQITGERLTTEGVSELLTRSLGSTFARRRFLTTRSGSHLPERRRKPR